MKHILLSFLALAATVLAQNVKSNIPYVENGHARHVLDIYSPANAKNLPVVFWIHGGGWTQGDKTDVKLKPQWFMDKGFVFVSTNYRLLPEVDMGTLTRDVAKAFGWMEKHIAEYGGDPKRVLVGGHSAGAELAALEKANVFVDRIVPASWPDDPPSGHFAETRAIGAAEPEVLLHWAHADGVASLPLQGGLPRALIPRPAPAGTRWSATPAAVGAAEQWLGMPVNVMSRAERALQAARSLWDLRQFELAQRTRGARALRDGLRKFASPAWRPVRLGLAALVAAQVVGLNLWAWHQRSSIESRQKAIQAAVRTAFPRASDLDIQRDAAAVVQRELQSLRTLAGKPGETDLETMLMVAASAWPPDRPPIDTLRYESGRLTLAAAGWSEPQVAQFRSLLQPGGWQVESNGSGQLVLSRGRSGGRS